MECRATSAGTGRPEGIKLPNPVFDWPPRPMAVAKWAFNYLFPWNFVYMLIAVLTVVYLQPEMSRMTRFSADWNPLSIRAQPGHADRDCQRMAPVAVGAQVAGFTVQVHSGLDGKGQEAVLGGQPAVRQHLLELRQRRHHLDGLRGGNAVGLRQRVHPLPGPARASGLFCPDAVRHPVVAAVPFLLGASSAALAAALQGGALSAPPQHQRRPLVRAVDCTRSNTSSTSAVC